MTTLRRFLVFQAFLLWQGGFLFYTAVVVPIGTEVLESAKDQGFVTQRVTNWLNYFGALWALVFLWDLVRERGPRWRWIGWAAAVVMLVPLFWLHVEMDTYLDAAEFRVVERRPFQLLHIVYLWISTFHWLIGLGLAWLTLRVWGRMERG